MTRLALFLAVLAKPAQRHFTRGGAVSRRWDLPAAPGFATAFCPSVGCPLSRLSRDAGRAVFSAGSLDDDPGMRPAFHEHMDSCANWISLDESALAWWPGDAK